MEENPEKTEQSQSYSRAGADVRKGGRQIELVNRIGESIVRADDFESALEEALAGLGEVAGWQFGEAWLPIEGASDPELNLRGTWSPSRPEEGAGQDGFGDFIAVSARMSFAFGEGLPGRTLERAGPIWLRDVRSQPWYQRARLAADHDIGSALSVPLVADGSPSGVLIWYSTELSSREEAMVDLAESICQTLGLLLHQRSIESDLREERDRFRLVADNVAEVFWLAIPGDEGPETIYVSPAFERVWGRSIDSLYSGIEPWLQTIHPEDRPRIRRAIKRQAIGDYDEEFRIIRPGGEVRWVHDRAYPVRENGEVVRLVGVAEDITRHKENEAELERRALYDVLTGLPNQNHFRDRLSGALEREESRVAVIFLDLDRFKVVNDTLGHPAGDELLCQVAGRLTEAVPGDVTVGRFGSDQFVMLVEEVDGVEEVERLTDAIIEQLTRPLEVAGIELHPTAGIGIALGGGGESSADDLLRFADMAMHRSKDSDESGVCFYDAQGDGREARRLHVEHDLRRAVEREEFVLDYQPVFDLQEGGVVGVEALVRWEHPDRGIVSPGEFIPVAEETGLIVPIGYWVLEESMETIADWQERFPTICRDQSFRLGVNLSVRQYREAELVGQILEIANRTGFPLDALILEITESILIASHDRLQELRDRGVRIAIDDFGTGYSSMQYLLDLEADELKIDRSFIDKLGERSRESILVEAILSMGEKLGLAIIAEGIETEEQRGHLVELGGTFGQGYYFDRPMRAAEFEAKHLEE